MLAIRWHDRFGASGLVALRHCNLSLAEATVKGVYNDFDIILDHFPRVFQLHPTPHALWAVFELVPRLTSC